MSAPTPSRRSGPVISPGYIRTYHLVMHRSPGIPLHDVVQAVRRVTPPLLNDLVALQKDVALLSVLGVRDAVREAQIYTARTFNYSSLICAAILFLLATIPLARLTDHLQRRDRQRRLQGVL